MRKKTTADKPSCARPSHVLVTARVLYQRADPTRFTRPLYGMSELFKTVHQYTLHVVHVSALQYPCPDTVPCPLRPFHPLHAPFLYRLKLAQRRLGGDEYCDAHICLARIPCCDRPSQHTTAPHMLLLVKFTPCDQDQVVSLCHSSFRREHRCHDRVKLVAISPRPIFSNRNSNQPNLSEHHRRAEGAVTHRTDLELIGAERRHGDTQRSAPLQKQSSSLHCTVHYRCQH